MKDDEPKSDSSFSAEQLSSGSRDDSTITSTVETSQQIHDLAQKYSSKQRGSVNYRKAWRHWSRLAVDAIREELAEHHIAPMSEQDEANFQNLAYRLGVAADYGEMPSFENSGARTGYALDYFCRARLLSDILIVDDAMVPDFWSNNDSNDADTDTDRNILSCDVEDRYPLFPVSSTTSRCNITSLGGGPGFDFVAAALVAQFRNSGRREGGQGKHDDDLRTLMSIDTTILDYEDGWEDLVNAMESATQNVILESHDRYKCRWGGRCDITKSIYDEVNVGWTETMLPNTNIWTCQYCIAENANKLRDSNYIFFKELFEAAKVGSVFILTETTPRLWPELYDLIIDTEPYKYYMEVGFVNMRGEQMILQKKCIASNNKKLSAKDEGLLHRFRMYSNRNEGRVSKGWIRQTPKIHECVNM